MQLKNVVNPLLVWFSENKRDLPWRHTTDSYKIWISEVMLQQTRVEAVKEYYKRFLKEIPNIESLANIEDDTLLKLWEGLGYYSRARNLKKCAQIIIQEGKKELPRDYEELKKLPGIGPYAAGSITSIAYGSKTPAIDGNVLRVLSRLLEDERTIKKEIVRKEYFLLLQNIMPEDTRGFTESLMELGALICLPNGLPLCEVCPIKKYCRAFKNETVLNFPIKEKARKRRVEQKTVFLLEYKKEFAILKRSENGLLAHLYELPNIDFNLDREQLKNYFTENNLVEKEVQVLPNTKHIFSHLEWQMTGYYVKLLKKPEKEYIWAEYHKIITQYSIPKAFKKYLEEMERFTN